MKHNCERLRTSPRFVTLISLLALSICTSVLAQQNPPETRVNPIPRRRREPLRIKSQRAPFPRKAEAEALQKATQNPVAVLISVPVQNNTNFNIGPYDRVQDVLNIQPAIPAHISKNWK